MEDERCHKKIEDKNHPPIVSEEYSSVDYIWEDDENTPLGKSEGVSLKNIGFTGIDNGLISYDKGTITNEEFYKILTTEEYSYDIAAGDYSLKLHPITGNSQIYSYDMSFNPEGYIECKGGFLQGFYKLFGHDYQILPQNIENEWNLEFVLRPRNYEVKNNSLNATHSGNTGIFFYMGTRAENKFSQFYRSDLDKFPKRDMSYYEGDCSNYMTGSYFEFDWNLGREEYDKRKINKLLLIAFLYKNFDYNSNCSCPNKEEKTYYQKVLDACSNYLAEPEYYETEASLSGLTIMSKNGVPIENHNYFELETDNKFLFFNRACGGFTTKTWDDNNIMLLTGITHNNKDNLFLIMNRGKNGYTTETIEDFYKESENENKYNVLKDSFSNSFALRITEEGAIGYKYLIKDCDNPKGYTVKEGASLPGIIKSDDWNVVNVAFKILYGNTDSCGNSYGNRKMKLYFYVNGKLKFISNELPELNFKELNEAADKQEGVPFNISLGGGTQGLCDSIWLDFNKVFEWVLPIEENFAGTFIGDIKSFKFYNCGMQYQEIINNYLYEKAKWTVKKA